MATLQDYYVKGENPHFLTKEYQDTIALKQYIRSLQNNRKPEKSIYGFTYSMVETMSQLRFHAEDEYKQHSFMINDKREALPISWNKILDVFTGTSSEPPQTLITQIAQQHIDIITEFQRKTFSRNLDQYLQRCLSPMRQDVFSAVSVFCPESSGRTFLAGIS